MKHLGFQKISKKDRRYYLKQINITFLAISILCFIIFAFYQKTTELIFSKDKINIFKEDLQQIAVYFRNFDQDLSQLLLKIDDISQAYSKGENILQTKQNEIEDARLFINKNKEYLKKIGFAQYDQFFDFMKKLRVHQDELFRLLGSDQEFNYLIILQNTNEKRPNGGFFGSFAFVSIQGGHITNFEIVDSYYPDFIAYRTRLLAPQRAEVFLTERKIGFLTSNKFGFTDIDGKNIKDLYEKMFNETFVMSKVEQTMEPELYDKLLHKYIKGVIFVRGDLFEEILPGFTEKMRERQFLNASVDLIRGESRGNKKELYIDEITNFVDEHKFTIAQNLINNFDTILEKNYIQIYLSNVSTGMNSFLVENHLQNIYSPDKIYARDTNSSNSKVDSFVTKNIQISDTNGNILIDTHNDIVDINSLGTGDYKMEILYSLNVPQYYSDFIAELEQKYSIQITDREKGILALQPALYTNEGIPRRRESKSTVFFPPQTIIHSVEGEILQKDFFDADFAKGVFYQSRITENNSTRKITITFSLL